jgi:hypothetical protein
LQRIVPVLISIVSPQNALLLPAYVQKIKLIVKKISNR